MTITISAVLPTYADPNLSMLDMTLYNAQRDQATRQMIEKAIRSVLVKRGAWEPRIKIKFDTIDA